MPERVVYPSISILVPTYKEAATIAGLIRAIDAVLVRGEQMDLELIIVDDDSGDGIETVVTALGLPWVRFLRRCAKPRGLSESVLYGVDFATKDVLVVMDADLSHPPEAIPGMLRRLTSGYDMVVGSRYVEGGGTDDDWGLLRCLNSRIATWLTRPLTDLKDPMSGFFALFRANMVPRAPLRPTGYKIGLEIIVKCGFKRLAEVPIQFRNRTAGQSKLSFKEQLRFLRHLSRLYLYRVRVATGLFPQVETGERGIARNLPRVVMFMGYLLYLCLHFQTGGAAPIADDFRQIAYTQSLDSVWDCFQLESFGMFRPTKSLLFYLAAQTGFGAFQWIGALMAGLCLWVTYRLLRRLSFSPWLAVFGALTWLYLPLQVVIFNWASALNISVYYFFSILSVLWADSYVKASRRHVRSGCLLLCCLAYGCALLSYEMALSVPLLIWLYIAIFLREPRQTASTIWLGVGLGLVTLAYFWARSVLLSGATSVIAENALIGTAKWWEVSWASSVSYFEHLRFLFWPYSGFEFLIPFDPFSRRLDALFAWLAIAVSLLLAFKCFSRFKYAAFALLWSAVALATILNFIPIGAGPLAEYYMPLASFAWVAAMVAGCHRIGFLRRRSAWLWIFPILLFGAEVLERERLWRSEASLYAGVVENTERAHAPFVRLSQIRLQEGRPAEALELIETAMEMAPGRADYVAVWLSILSGSELPQARMVLLFEEALKAYPEAPAILLVRGDAFAEAGDYQCAANVYLQAYAHARTGRVRAQALNHLGILEIARGNLAEAEVYFREAYQLNPQDAGNRRNLENVRKALSTADTQ